MGTPEFAANCLQYLLDHKVHIVGVVTMPDKPAGRGRQIFESPVKKIATNANIPVLQPVSLKDAVFHSALKALNPDVQIVVAFRMLPEIVWNLPPYGTYNLHASILPQYRGAAPINWAIINGEEKTGVSFFKLKHEIDSGDVMETREIIINENCNVGDLHNQLCDLGKELILFCLKKIETGDVVLHSQNTIVTNGELKSAPKLNKQNTVISWNENAMHIHNLIRGLSPYPGAWTKLLNNNNLIEPVKIFKTTISILSSKEQAGCIRFNEGNLQVSTKDFYINILELQIPGKSKVDGKSFWNGLKDKEQTKFID